MSLTDINDNRKLNVWTLVFPADPKTGARLGNIPSAILVDGKTYPVVGYCRDCRHFMDGDPGNLQCDNPQSKMSTEDSFIPVLVEEDFGCVQWEGKG